MTPFEAARQLEQAASAMRRAVAFAEEVAERVGLDALPARRLDLAEWLSGQRAEFAVRAREGGVDPFDPRYARRWGWDTDAIRADMEAAGISLCAMWDCVQRGVAVVRWRRTWAGGSHEGLTRYCGRHHAELRSGAAWANADARVTYAPEEVIASERAS